MDEIWRMQRVVTWEVFSENERDGLMQLSKLSRVIRK